MTYTANDDKSLVSEFAAALREMGGADSMARQLAAANGWNEAFRVACDAAEPLLPNAGAEHVVRSIFRAMQERGIEAMWPLKFGEMP